MRKPAPAARKHPRRYTAGTPRTGTGGGGAPAWWGDSGWSTDDSVASATEPLGRGVVGPSWASARSAAASRRLPATGEEAEAEAAEAAESGAAGGVQLARLSKMEEVD